MSACNFELLSRYIDGEITLPDRRLLELHLVDCGTCSAELDDLRAMEQVLDRWAAQRLLMPADTERRVVRAVQRRRLAPFLAATRMMPAAIGSAIAAVLVLMSANMGWMYSAHPRMTPQPALQVAELAKQSSPLVNARRTSAMLAGRSVASPQHLEKYQAVINVD